MMFSFFSLSMACFAIMLSTFLKTTKAAYTCSYVFILAGLVLQLLMSNVKIIYALYSREAPDWVGTLIVIFTLYPPFNFSKIFGDVARRSSVHWSHSEHNMVPGIPYPWHRITHRI